MYKVDYLATADGEKMPDFYSKINNNYPEMIWSR